MAADRTLVVADDLTGAMDTGHSFAMRGYGTFVRLDPEFDTPEAAVIVADTDSRYVSPDEAAARVRSVVASTDASIVYKKVDSTLRGNVGVEIAAAHDAMDAEATAVAPAYPSNGRLTACGNHLVDGELLTDTEVGMDPDSNINTSHVPRLLREQIGGPVVHAGVECVASRSTVDAFQRPDGFEADDRLVVVFDIVHDSHLDTVAAGAHEHDGDVLLVGSAGLAEYVRSPGEAGKGSPSVATNSSGIAFGVAGSVNPRTLTQLDTVPKSQVVHLDARTAVTAPDDAAKNAAEECLERFQTEPAVVLTAASDSDTVAATLEAAKDVNISGREARERITASLGVATRVVWTKRSPDGLFLTGGSIAKSILDRLDADGLALHGEEIDIGVPVGEIRGGSGDGAPVVTKAGAFGGNSTIVDALDHLRRV